MTLMPLWELAKELGEGFLLVDRSTLVSARAIHEVSNKIYLSDGEALDYVVRRKKEVKSELWEIQKRIIGSFAGEDVPKTYEEYCRHYRSYEQAALYGEKLEIIDYSPEIDTYLKVICFPTFPGHCGCILFSIEDIRFTKNSGDAEKTLMLYLQNEDLGYKLLRRHK